MYWLRFKLHVSILELIQFKDKSWYRRQKQTSKWKALCLHNGPQLRNWNIGTIGWIVSKIRTRRNCAQHMYTHIGLDSSHIRGPVQLTINVIKRTFQTRTKRLVTTLFSIQKTVSPSIDLEPAQPPAKALARSHTSHSLFSQSTILYTSLELNSIQYIIMPWFNC